jgi:ATP-dependent helicase HrpB
LSSFALDLAAWGVADPSTLAFLDPPPDAAFAEAKALLLELGAIDVSGRITEEGRKLRALPLPPRLARMVVDAAAEGGGLQAAYIAAILTERGLGGDDVDLAHRLNQFRRDRSPRAEDARRMAQRWAELATASSPSPIPPSRTASRSSLPHKGGGEKRDLRDAGSLGVILARAYPDRIARNRGAGSGVFLLANGRGASLDPACALAREPYLAVAELTGGAAQGRIVLAAKITAAEIEAHFAARIDVREEVTFDAASASLRARRLRRLGALSLAEQPLPLAPDADTARVLAEGIAKLGIGRLPWTKSLRQWRDRVTFLRRAEGDEWPDLSDQALAAHVADWLAPALLDKTALADMSASDLETALQALLPWNLRGRLDAEAPTHFEAPTGTRVPIDYEAEEGPKIAIRVQELFGLNRHPAIADGKVALIVELLSPAHRPVQVTRDLPGFWRGSYAAVRAEMKGRYPKHPWPEDPLAAMPTRRAKPRGR